MPLAPGRPRTPVLALLAALLAGAVLAGPSATAGTPGTPGAGVAKGDANATFAAGPGPYQVAATRTLGDCRALQRLVLALVVPGTDFSCSDAFPYGFDRPVTSMAYYPTDAPADRRLPVVNLVGGIFSDVGHYRTLARHLAGHGVVVTVSSDVVNSSPAMHLLGLQTARSLQDDPASPVHGRLDLGRTVVAGHSAGGAAALQTASLTPAQLARIDPRLRLVGALALEPGPGALGSTVRTSTLVLTGAQDRTVPAGTWPLVSQYLLVRRAPAWFATADTADHFSPVRSRLDEDELAGIATAFVLYRTTDDPVARSFFEGERYRLAQDEQFVTDPSSPLRVRRNAVAAAL